MAKYHKGNLSRFVRQVMKQKGLTQRDIELRSGGKITDGYVADILSGDAKNPSAEKIKALAQGLGINPHELFDVVCGPFEEGDSEHGIVALSPIVPFLELMLEVANDPELLKIVQELIRLYPEERAVLLQSAETFNKRKQKPQCRKGSKRDKEKT